MINFFKFFTSPLPRLHASLLLLSVPTSLFADKLDSLLHIHDTTTIVYYYHLTDNLAAGIFKLSAVTA